MFDSQGRVRERRGATVRFSFFAQKAAWNEALIGGLIHDLFPTDGNLPYARLDLLDLSMALKVHDIGSGPQVQNEISTE
jgi:hypothetical protein